MKPWQDYDQHCRFWDRALGEGVRGWEFYIHESNEFSFGTAYVLRKGGEAANYRLTPRWYWPWSHKRTDVPGDFWTAE